MIYGVVRIDVSTLQKRLVSVWENPDDVPGLLEIESIVSSKTKQDIETAIRHYNTKTPVNTYFFNGKDKEIIMNWDFSKLPESEYQNVIEALRGHNTGRLILIHDRYELSKNQYCCLGPERTGEVFDFYEDFMTTKGLI